MIEQPVWPFGPYGDGVTERIEWATDVIRARNGSQTKRQLAQRPRRTFDYETVLTEQDRTFASLLINDLGVSECVMPVWHDSQAVGPISATPFNAGSGEFDDAVIACSTAGYDFFAGGLAVLLHKGRRLALEILSVQSDGLTLADPIAALWPLGTKLAPAYISTLSASSSELGLTKRIGRVSLSFQIKADHSWPALTWDAYHIGLPVLTRRPLIGGGIQRSLVRDIVEIDVGVGPISRTDYPGRAFRSVALEFLARDRASAGALRALVYGLRGRAGNVWVPTWASDLELSGTSSGTLLRVKWVGYALHGRQQNSIRDIRIVLSSGVVLYRRIVASFDEAGVTERLTLNSALPSPLSPGGARLISFMSLSEADSDRVEIQHPQSADKRTLTSISFKAIKYEPT